MKSNPKIGHYKRKNLAYVYIHGRQVFLGKYGSPESKIEYHRVVAEALAGQEVGPAARKRTRTLTVADLATQFMRRRVEPYYKQSGRSSEITNIRHALVPLTALYGDQPASKFGPLQLKAVRAALIAGDNQEPPQWRAQARTTINRNISRIRQLFRWCVSEELAKPDQLTSLEAVDGLERGRSAARETDPVAPVPTADLDATLPHLAPKVRAIVDLLLLCAARPGEVCKLRPIDLDRTGPVWRCQLASHKTDHHGKSRTLLFGPKAQAILAPWIADRLETHYLFAPAGPGGRPKPKQAKSKPYSVSVLRNEVAKACVKAGVPPWHPNQLRHTAATLVRARYGLEAAQVVLGHAKADVTQHYAERDLAKAVEVMREIG